MKFFLMLVPLAAVLLAVPHRVEAQLFDCFAQGEVPSGECVALTELYDATDGWNWTDNSGWLEIGTPISEWSGVTVSGGHVIWLQLNGNGLNGSLPAEIGNMPDLQVLYLSNNSLTGAIPASVGQLTQLEQLDLGVNQLGDIPDALGDLSNLWYLNLGTNNFSGPLPSSLGNLTGLTQLYLDTNGFTGSIPSTYTNLSALEIFHFHNTSLCEPQDSDFQTWINSIQDVQNTGTSCTFSCSTQSEIPETECEALVALYNATGGDEWTNNSGWLDAAVPIGNWYGVTLTFDENNVRSLGLAFNNLVGSVPESINDLASLIELFLERNSLEDLPALTALSGAGDVDVSKNKLTFEDLEANVGLLFGVDFAYAPQADIGEDRTIQLNEGDPLTLNLPDPVGGQNNTYQWLKGDQPIPGATSATYSINDVTMGDAGIYRLEINNTVATALTLQSRPITVQVESINEPPDAVDDAVTTPEGTPIDIDVLNNDSDPDGDLLTVIQVSDPANGSASILNGGTGATQVRYTPAPGFSGTDSFTYTVSDGTGGTAQATVTVTVEAAPQPQLTVTSPNGGETWTGGETHEITWTSQNFDADVEIVLTRDSGGGTILASPVRNDGVFEWTIPATVEAADDYRIVVSPVDEGPQLDESDDTFSIVAPPRELTVTSPNGGETWTQGETRLIEWQSPNLSGNVIIMLMRDNGSDTRIAETTNDGAYDWAIPETVEAAGDYRIRIDAVDEDIFDSSDGTFSIVAFPQLHIAVDDEVATPQDTPIDIDVLNNDSDPDGDLLTVIQVSDPANGSATIINGGTGSAQVRYTPEADFSGTDSFIYTVSDGNGGTDGATVTVTVEAAPQPQLTVTSPNDGAQWTRGEQEEIRWTSQNHSGNVRIELWRDGVFVETIRQSTPDDGVHSWEVPGHLAVGNGYRVRISSLNDTGLFDESGTFSIRGVEVVVTVVGNAPVPDDDYELEILVSGNAEPLSQQLFVRQGGEGEQAYVSRTLNRVGDRLTAMIPRAYVTKRGIEYYVRLEFNGGTVVTYPEDNPQQEPAYLPVRLRTPFAPVNLVPKQHRMVSVPIMLDNPELRSVFDEYDDPYDKEQARVQLWNETQQRYDDLPVINKDVEPGAAFWVITGEEFPFFVENGVSVPSGDYTLSLQRGWNQIATPFAFPVAWEDVEGTSGLDGPWHYTGNAVDPYGPAPVSVLEPWDGYFVKADRARTITFPYREATVTQQATPPPALAAEADYAVTLRAALIGHGLQDGSNVLGLRAGAAAGRDAYDMAEPPAIAEHVRLSILQGEERLAASVKPFGGTGQAWDLEVGAQVVERYATRKRAVVALEERGLRPEGHTLYLLDLDHKRRLPIVEGRFEVELNERFPVRRLRLFVGTEAYAGAEAGDIPLVPQQHALLSSYPNPFNPETAIRYEVSRRAHVRLEVYDVLGRRVRALLGAEQEPGAYTVRWDGTDAAGRSVASGVYLVHMQAGGYASTLQVLLLK